MINLEWIIDNVFKFNFIIYGIKLKVLLNLRVKQSFYLYFVKSSNCIKIWMDD